MDMAELKAENARLQKELDERDTAKFDEIKKENDDNVVELDKVRKQRDAEKKRADNAEKENGETKEKAAFAEIERDLAEEIKTGLPKDLHDDFRALRAHELGIVTDGVATFAEGKTSDKSVTELIKIVREAKRVPVEDEKTKHIDKNKIDIATFSESDMAAAHEKRIKLTDERVEELKKTNEGATFAEAAQQIQNENPELYVDYFVN